VDTAECMSQLRGMGRDRNRQTEIHIYRDKGRRGKQAVRDTERQTGKTEVDRDRQRTRETERRRESERVIHKEIERHRYIQKDRGDRQEVRDTERQLEIQIGS